MKTLVVVCLVGAMLAAIIALAFLTSKGADQRYYRARNEIERIAFRKDESEELKKAVGEERLADKARFINRDLGTKFVWISLGLSGAALLIVLLGIKQRKPIQPTETTRGNGT